MAAQWDGRYIFFFRIFMFARWKKIQRFIIHLPFSPSNENFGKIFITRLNHFTNGKCKVNIVWNTRKAQSLFPLKDKVDHYSRVIYWEDYSCNQNYIGETVLNAKTRQNEHEDKNSKIKSTSHLKENPTNNFKWSIISKYRENFRKRGVLKANFIKTICSTLNEQLGNYILTFFRNDITYI